MYDLDYIVAGRQKSCRWNTVVKVTAHSVETTWSQKQLVGISVSTQWKLDNRVSIVCESFANVLKLTTASVQANWTTAAVVRIISDTNWSICFTRKRYRKVVFGNHHNVAVSAETTWNINRPIAKWLLIVYDNHILMFRQMGVIFDVASLVGISKCAGYSDRQVIGTSVQTNWNVSHFGISATTFWNTASPATAIATTQSNTLITVGKQVNVVWNDNVGVYLLKFISYNIRDGLRFAYADRPTLMNVPKEAMIPNITWKRLSAKQKLKVK
jgi:hypothetical protein